MGWPQVELREVLRPDLVPVRVNPADTYEMVGVYSFGRGLFRREPVQGSNTSYKFFYRLRADHFVMSQLFGWEGALALSSDEFCGQYVSPQFPTFLCDQQRLNRHFLGWVARMPSFWDDLATRTRGMGDRRRTLNPEALLLCKIPLPPFDEQRRIVSRIEELAGKVREARNLRESSVSAATAFAASETNRALTGAQARGWPEVSLGDVAEIRSGVTLGRRLDGLTIRLPYLRVANVQDGRLDLSVIKEVEILADEAQKWQLMPGDVLLTEGGDWDKLGRGTVWRGQIPNCIHQNHIFRVRANPREFEPDFVAAIIGSPYGKSYFQAASKQTTNLASINQQQLKAFRIFRPPLETQRGFVERITTLQASMNGLRSIQSETAAELDALMPSILSKAFRGEL